jgi:hypothetical protein
MINKRLLIKNIISHNDEGTFYEKKSEIDIKTDRGRSKILKAISALSNSNPDNDSFLIFGIRDGTNEIIGVGFVDDSRIQDLVKSFLSNPPILIYENIPFPDLHTGRSIGLLTIRPSIERTYFKKKIWKIEAKTSYYRKGSKSIPNDEDFYTDKSNEETVKLLKNNSRNDYKMILGGVHEFFKSTHSEYNPQFLLFQEQFAVCWSGWPDTYGDKKCYCEVDIQIINENKRIFFSAVHYVDVKIMDTSMKVIRFEPLGFDDNFKLYPIEETRIIFQSNGTYKITENFIFSPPQFEKKKVIELYSRTKRYVENFKKKRVSDEDDFGEGIANYFLICYLNGIDEARDDFMDGRNYLDGAAAEWWVECAEILNKYEKMTEKD